MVTEKDRNKKSVAAIMPECTRRLFVKVFRRRLEIDFLEKRMPFKKTARVSSYSGAF
jgi:hypothetical protein